MNEAYIGVDVGTLSARAGVFDFDGRLMASARRPIAIWREPGEIVEQSSDDIWRAVTSAVREAIEASGLPPEAIAGMGFDATCSLVALDRDARPLSVSPTGAPERDVIVWMDHRAAADADRINAGGHATLRYVGGLISPEMHAPKLAWLARRKPEMIAEAGHFFDLTDFLSYRATGSLTRSTCTTTCKFGYLGAGKTMAGRILRLRGSRLPQTRRLRPHWRSSGAAGRAAWPGTDRRVRGRDGLAAGNSGRRGAGRRPRGRRGHAGRARGRGAGRSAPAPGADPRHLVELHGALGRAAIRRRRMGTAFRGADSRSMAHRWRTVGVRRGDRSSLAAHPAFAALSERAGPRALAALEKDIVARAGGLSQAALIAEGLHVLPDFIGSRSPLADPGARGGVLGMDLREDAASLQELYVAGLCGLAYGLADIVRKLERTGYEFDAIVVSGGAARSPLVRQIIADVCGKTVEAPETPEPVLLGSAMIGAVAAGTQTLVSAMESMSRSRFARPRPAGRSRRSTRRKHRAHEILRQAEREIRHANLKARWPEVVIFDCDGVLVDSEVIALAVTRRRLREAGLQLSDEETRERFLGLRLDSVVRRIETELGAPLPKEFPDDLSREILATFARELKGVEGVRQAVGGLRARVCVASSSAPERLRFALRVTGYESLFAPNIFSAAEVAQGKPSPDLFLFAARAMGAAPKDCLVIEDSVAGVAAARAAGMTGVRVRRRQVISPVSARGPI